MCALPREVGLSGFAEGDVSLVQLDPEPGDFLVLRGLEVNDGLVVIDEHVFALGQQRAVLPFGVHAGGLVAAVNGVDDDSL